MAKTRQEAAISRNGRWMELMERIRTSFWFVPSLLSIGALLLVFGAVELDRREFLAGYFPEWAEDAAHDSARLLLNGIAGSMITMATVSFSIIIVALAFASAQLGPRLLRNFIRDRTNQFVLGGFLATHVYCLALLTSLAALKTYDWEFVPRISMVLALALGFGAFGLLIYFIHHIAVGIQTDTVVADVRRNLARTIDEFLPDESCDETEDEPVPEFDSGPTQDVLHADRTGYVQVVDYAALVALARGGETRFQCPVRAGSYVMESSATLTWRARSDGALDESALRSAVLIGFQKTDAQDLAYSLDQLVEIALRALSPGINDPFTATTCLDDIGGALAKVADRRFPSPDIRDEDGVVRVVRAVLRFEDLVRNSIGDIRRASAGQLRVVTRLLEVIGEIKAVTRLESRRKALDAEAEAMAKVALTDDLPAPDRRVIEAALERARTSPVIR